MVNYEIELTFMGVNDDGLAERQTGKSASISGNALEALEMFNIGLEFNKKRLHPSSRYQSQILSTGDSDMVRVPKMTKIKFVIFGNTKEILEYTIEKIYDTAYGAALMTGCKVERSHQMIG